MKQKGQVQIIMCDDNKNPFIATLQNILLEPDLCNRLFLIITLPNLGHTYLFHKWFGNMYFGYKDKRRLPYHILHRGNISFGGK